MKWNLSLQHVSTGLWNVSTIYHMMTSGPQSLTLLRFVADGQWREMKTTNFFPQSKIKWKLSRANITKMHLFEWFFLWTMWHFCALRDWPPQQLRCFVVKYHIPHTTRNDVDYKIPRLPSSTTRWKKRHFQDENTAGIKTTTNFGIHIKSLLQKNIICTLIKVT